jgi:hypothetical protein
MDRGERARLKQLANDAIIASFGFDSRESQLAEALERCVDELEQANDKCRVCSTCEGHGDHVDESLHIDPDEVVEAHRALEAKLALLKDRHVELAGICGELEVGAEAVDALGNIIEDLESDLDDLQEVVLP